MKTEGRRASSTIEDQRGVRFWGLPAGGRGIGLLARPQARVRAEEDGF